jgi:hypothetical protein
VGGVGVWRVVAGAGRGPGYSGRWRSKSIQKESKEGIEAPYGAISTHIVVESGKKDH